MPQPSKIPLAFAASGDKNVIPKSTETTGLASWREGFPAITSAPFSEGGIAPKRADFNGIFNALSQSVIWLQQGGVYAYDVNTDYEAGNVVLDAGGLYVANAGNGPSSVVVQPSTDATGATWKLVRLDLATQSAAGYMSAADKTKLDGLLPVGTILFIAGNVVPENCVPAVGELLDTRAYAELFSVTGHLYGDSLDPTKFYAPDMRNRFPEGAQTAGGYNEPGLPDIRGNITLHGSQVKSVVSSVTGAFESLKTNSNATNGTAIIEQQSVGVIRFKASNSSTVYGASTTVQPASVKLLPVIVYRSKHTVVDN